MDHAFVSGNHNVSCRTSNSRMVSFHCCSPCGTKSHVFISVFRAKLMYSSALYQHTMVLFKSKVWQSPKLWNPVIQGAILENGWKDKILENLNWIFQSLVEFCIIYIWHCSHDNGNCGKGVVKRSSVCWFKTFPTALRKMLHLQVMELWAVPHEPVIHGDIVVMLLNPIFGYHILPCV